MLLAVTECRLANPVLSQTLTYGEQWLLVFSVLSIMLQSLFPLFVVCRVFSKLQNCYGIADSVMRCSGECVRKGQAHAGGLNLLPQF